MVFCYKKYAKITAIFLNAVRTFGLICFSFLDAQIGSTGSIGDLISMSQNTRLEEISNKQGKHWETSGTTRGGAHVIP
jgi:hypothetical protein